MTRTLDRSCEVTLMSCAGTCYTAGKNLSSFGQVTANAVNILVVDMLYLINTESANFPAAFSASVRSFSHLGFSFRENYLNKLFSIKMVNHRRAAYPENRRLFRSGKRAAPAGAPAPDTAGSGYTAEAENTDYRRTGLNSPFSRP